MDSLTELFCLIDDFCHQFEPALERRLLETRVKKRKRCSGLSLSELMTLTVLFHQLRFRQFKSFYLVYACHYLWPEFPKLRAINDAWNFCPAVWFLRQLCSRCSKASATGFPLPMPLRLPFAITGASLAIGSLQTVPDAVKPQWAGSMDSSSMSLSTLILQPYIFSLGRRKSSAPVMSLPGSVFVFCATRTSAAHAQQPGWCATADATAACAIRAHSR